LEGNVNWLAVVIAAIANMVIGFLWYSNWAFGKSWSSLQGGRMMGQAPGPIVLVVVAAIVQAITMAWFAANTGTNSGSAGALLGLFVGLGFIAPAMFADVIFAGRPPRLHAITAGYQVVAAIVQGSIMGFLGTH
jgi:hypothetical protein